MTLLIVQFGKGKYNLRRKVGGHWKSTLRLTLSLVTELASVSSDEHNAAQLLTNFKKVNLCIAHLIRYKFIKISYIPGWRDGDSWSNTIINYEQH